MTSVLNLFSNFSDSNKNKSITEIAAEYKNRKPDLNTQSPALSQGEKFKKYQKKIKKNLEKNINNVNSKEGFQGIQDIQNNLQLNPNSLTSQSINIIENNNYTSQQQQTIANLQEEYQNTLSEYESLTAQINGATTGYLNRVNPNNPYLGKNIKIGKNVMYVTQQGVAKLYPTKAIFNSTAGSNNCPSQQSIVTLNIPWSSSYATAGVNIPSNPPLITGTPMTAEQSCGNEGTNVFVNKLINNPTATYQGCYADNTTNPLMTFIGGAPQPPSVNLQNGNFSQPQIPNNTYSFINSNTTVPGWNFNALIFNNWGGWGYPLPYPQGSQCAAIYLNAIISQNIQLNSGTYNLSFYACSATNYGSAPVNVFLGGQSNIIYNFTPTTTSGWQQYNTSFTITSSGNYALGFQTLQGSNQWSNVGIQNIQISVSGTSESGTYTYNQCKNAAIDAGYQYFALQDVNTSTSQGYCAVSDNQPVITSLGPGLVPNGQQALWASNTSGQNGNTAILSITGALSVLNANGSSVYNSPTSNANPSNYLGCYGDGPNRAMPLYNNGAQQYNNAQCQQIAQQNGALYYGLQNSTSGQTAQCAISSDWAQTSQYGTAGNCTEIGDGSYSGGGWSNAVYNASLPQSNYFLILQDDGNMVIYRGTSPTDIQGVIWATGTNGQLQDANPTYAAANGKYGQNWISQGSTLATGDFIGSTSGNLALIMQSDGNLVLYTFTMVSNCQKMADGNTGAGIGSNALYDIGNTGIPDNMSQLAYIDQNSELHSYPSSNTKYSNTYTKMPGNDSSGHDIQGASFGNATVGSCKTACNKNADCAGFSFSNNVCYPKTSSMYPNGARELNPDFNLFIRGKKPISPPIGAPSTVNNVDSISYQNYVNGGNIGKKYGLANATSSQKQQLDQLQTRMNLLTSQINQMTGKFDSGTNKAQTQSQTNVEGIQEYLQGLESTNSQINNFNTNVERILSDSDIVVLQKNYDYLFWSILATGTVLITMNIIKN
jgi:hypothetical protein